MSEIFNSFTYVRVTSIQPGRIHPTAHDHATSPWLESDVYRDPSPGDSHTRHHPEGKCSGWSQTLRAHLRVPPAGCHCLNGWPYAKVTKGGPSSPDTKHRLDLCMNLSFPLQIKLTLWQGMDRLENWPSTLLQFRTTMTKVNPGANRFSTKSQSATFRLLRLVMHNEWSKTYQQIEGNFLAAAMHVACMKEFEFIQDSYPDIPEKLEQMVEGWVLLCMLKTSLTLLSFRTCPKPLPLSSQEEEDLNDLSLLSVLISQTVKGGDKLMFLRAPLQLSLLISPIYLLMPVQLVKRTYNRRNMVFINRLLGNGKTDLTIEIEKAIWMVVFALSEGRQDPAHLLKELCEVLPWDKINAADSSAEHCSWFNLSKSNIDSERTLLMNIVERCLPPQSAPTSTSVIDPPLTTSHLNTEPVRPLSSTMMDLDMDVSQPSIGEVAYPSQTSSESTISVDISQSHLDVDANPSGSTMDTTVDNPRDSDANPSQSTIDVSIDVCQSKWKTKDTIPAPTSAHAPMAIEDDSMDQDRDHSGISSLPTPSSKEDDHWTNTLQTPLPVALKWRWSTTQSSIAKSSPAS